MIDTGAKRSVISQAQADKWNLVPTGRRYILKGVGQAEARETKTVNIKVKDQEVSCSLLVVKGVEVPNLLGREELRKLGFEFGFRKEVQQINKVELTREQDEKDIQCFTLMETAIKEEKEEEAHNTTVSKNSPEENLKLLDDKLKHLEEEEQKKMREF